MASSAPRKLTERQQAVLERIDRRVPIKVIAQELRVSETRINQHIRALKDIYQAGSLNELVEEYRATLPPQDPAAQPEAQAQPPEKHEDAQSSKGLSEPAYSKSQVSRPAKDDQTGERVDRGELVMRDVLPLVEQAPWLRPGALSEPKVVPGVLDGEHAVLFRLLAIVGIGFGFMGALVLTLTAAITISEALDGRATVPVDSAGPS